VTLARTRARQLALTVLKKTGWQTVSMELEALKTVSGWHQAVDKENASGNSHGE